MGRSARKIHTFIRLVGRYLQIKRGPQPLTEFSAAVSFVRRNTIPKNTRFMRWVMTFVDIRMSYVMENQTASTLSWMKRDAQKTRHYQLGKNTNQVESVMISAMIITVKMKPIAMDTPMGSIVDYTVLRTNDWDTG
jgi:hypothetical protein